MTKFHLHILLVVIGILITGLVIGWELRSWYAGQTIQPTTFEEPVI